MSVFGTTLTDGLTSAFEGIAGQAAPYILTIVLVVVGIAILTFLLRFLKSHLAR